MGSTPTPRLRGARYSAGFISESSAMVFYNRWQELMGQ